MQRKKWITFLIIIQPTVSITHCECCRVDWSLSRLEMFWIFLHYKLPLDTRDAFRNLFPLQSGTFPAILHKLHFIDSYISLSLARGQMSKSWFFFFRKTAFHQKKKHLLEIIFWNRGFWPDIVGNPKLVQSFTDPHWRLHTPPYPVLYLCDSRVVYTGIISDEDRTDFALSVIYPSRKPSECLIWVIP